MLPVRVLIHWNKLGRELLVSASLAWLEALLQPQHKVIGLSSGVPGRNTVTCSIQEVGLGDLSIPFGLKLYEYSCKTNCLNPLPERWEGY